MAKKGSENNFLKTQKDYGVIEYVTNYKSGLLYLMCNNWKDRILKNTKVKICISSIELTRGKWKIILPTTILWLHAYLLVEILQEAIKDFQEVLDRLFVSSDNIFSCDIGLLGTSQ